MLVLLSLRPHLHSKYVHALEAHLVNVVVADNSPVPPTLVLYTGDCLVLANGSASKVGEIISGMFVCGPVTPCDGRSFSTRTASWLALARGSTVL